MFFPTQANDFYHSCGDLLEADEEEQQQHIADVKDTVVETNDGDDEKVNDSSKRNDDDAKTNGDDKIKNDDEKESKQRRHEQCQAKWAQWGRAKDISNVAVFLWKVRSKRCVSCVVGVCDGGVELGIRLYQPGSPV